MVSRHFIVTLKSDVIFVEDSATAGTQTTLKYLPGSAFLGSCAGKIYNELTKDVAFDIFHSGKVRFGDAYPLTDANVPTLPVSLAWHKEKNDQESELNNNSTFNLIWYDWEKKQPKGSQAKQIRDGFFTLCGSYFKPETNFRLKTSIDRDKFDRPKDENLFGYESLKTGAKFYFSVEFDGVDDAIIGKVVKAIKKISRIGKSRSAEYGAVEVIEVADNNNLKQFLTSIDNTEEFKDDKGNYIVIYALSDLALSDNGTPTLIPKADHFGIEGAFIAKRSFIRARTYSPYNNHRKANDLERQVICRGSVITFKLQGDIKEYKKRVVGIYQQDGLGKILVNPFFLKGDHPDLKKEHLPLVISNNVIQVPVDEALTMWIDKKQAEYEVEKNAIDSVDKWVEALADVIKDKKKAPANSQWRRLMDIAMGKNNGSFTGIETAINDLCNTGATKASEKWKEKIHYYKDKEPISFTDFLNKEVVNKEKISDDIKIVLQTENVTEREILLSIKKKLYLLGKKLPHKLNQIEGKENG